MVDACCYVVLTGCSWRMLPSDFPDWDNVYKTFRRWSKQGKF
jgi:putative transposase